MAAAPRALRLRVSHVALAALLSLAPRAARADVRPVPGETYSLIRIHAEDLSVTKGADAAIAYLDSVEFAARRRGESRRVLAARLYRARRLVNAGRRAELVALVDSLEREVKAARWPEATAWWLYSKASREEIRTNDPAKGFAGLEVCARYARQHGQRVVEAASRAALGDHYYDIGRSSDALRTLARAEVVAIPRTIAWVNIPNGRGNACNALGRPDEARKWFEVSAERARRMNRPDLERRAIYNLASLDFEEEDPAAALPNFERALALSVSPGELDQAPQIRLTRAWTIYRIGPPERGVAELRTLQKECDDPRQPALRALWNTYLAEACVATGENEVALRHARLALEQAPQATADVRTMAVSASARAFRANGLPREALALLDSTLADHSVERRPSDRLELEALRIELMLQAGRRGEALVAARAAERASRPDGPLKGAKWQDAGVLLARALRENGRPDSARVLLERLRRDWRRRRALIPREEWREGRGVSTAPLFAEMGLVLLDPQRRVPERTRVREAFDALQEYQARTLEERMRGSGVSARFAASRVTVDSLQRRVLRPDELLIDLVATPDTTIAFAVTRDGVTVRFLPGTDRIGPRVQRLTAAMESATTPLGPADALQWMSSQVLAPFAGLVASHRRLVITGGGPLALLPWPALPDANGRMLVESHEVALAPSATLWVGQRLARAGGGTGLLVLGRTKDAAGQPLDGVREECRSLADYANVTTRLNDGSDPLARLVGDLGRFDAIHLAAHMYSDNTNPWRSGVLMGRGTGDDAYLRASDVARRKLAARMVVLSGCQSAAARSLPGEGPQGIGAAFLCAGVRTVLATLWRVDDDAAAEFARRFYAELARGANVMSAQRAAQDAMRREGRPASGWAAFTVTGSGDTSLPLRRRTR